MIDRILLNHHSCKILYNCKYDLCFCRVGSAEGGKGHDIQLNGTYIKEEHCTFENDDGMYSFGYKHHIYPIYLPYICSFVEINHEIFSMVILSIPLIQEGQLSVSGKRMCTILVSHLEI